MTWLSVTNVLDDLWFRNPLGNWRYFLVLRDRNFDEAMAEDEYLIDGDPVEWLTANVRGLWKRSYYVTPFFHLVRFSRKSDMAMFILMCCERT